MLKYIKPYAAYKYIFITIVLSMFISVPIQVQSYQKEIPEYYPMSYDGMGVVDRKGDTEIVIGDIEYRLSVHVKYHTPWNRVSSGHNVKKGSYVGFITDGNKKIVSIWLINDYVDKRM